eukprot:9468962-Pyramimonas_sp.AAC.1
MQLQLGTVTHHLQPSRERRPQSGLGKIAWACVRQQWWEAGVHQQVANPPAPPPRGHDQV